MRGTWGRRENRDPNRSFSREMPWQELNAWKGCKLIVERFALILVPPNFLEPTLFEIAMATSFCDFPCFLGATHPCCLFQGFWGLPCPNSKENRKRKKAKKSQKQGMGIRVGWSRQKGFPDLFWFVPISRFLPVCSDCFRENPDLFWFVPICSY